MRVAPIGVSMNFKSNNINQQKQVDNNSTQTLSEDKPKKKTNWAAFTGWTAVAGVFITVISGYMKQPKTHILSAVVTAAAVAAHIGVISNHHGKHHHKEIHA